MEILTTLTAEEHFLPKIAIVGYESVKEYYTQENYFSFHNIVGGKLTAGMPLTKETARNIFECLETELFKYSFKGILPKSLVHFNLKGGLELLWYVHPKVHQLYFDAKTGIESGRYPMPKLLFQLHDKELKIYALNRSDSLTDETKVYHAPVLNCNAQGAICMGNASLNYDGFEYYEDIMGFVEQQFFRSVFTETHHNRLIKGNYVTTMKALKDTSRFDDTLLQENNQLLADLYEN